MRRGLGGRLQPRTRTDGVIVRAIGDEVVVYDRARHLAHCLNRTAAVVFRAADGRRTVAELAALMAADSGGEADEKLVWIALERLAEAHLLEGDALPSRPAARPAEPSRREALRRVGLGMAAVAPIVASLVVPTPAEAANTCIPAAACDGTNDDQPCHTGNPELDCLSKKCQGAGNCV
jgi:hypothetical protein